MIRFSYDARYKILLKIKGSYMGRYVREKEDKMKQLVPKDSIFYNNFFKDTCKMIQNRNEAKVVQDITYAKHLKCLIKSPILGDIMDESFFIATYYIYFPFLTCEVKCGAAALDIADWQNAYSMTLALVRIYGHYPIIKGKGTAFYYYLIYTFDFTELEGKEKIRSFINKLLPNFDFKVLLLLAESSLLQDLESHHLLRLFTEPESLLGERGS
ncbi:hypothetical protein CC80DRAFT_518397 [Byssothecium circinans]|uniref:DUF7924 domain-containing protein n=1 Tax=Byssothecium circinans TaxID=147558 RepID=A0A6A5TLK4_9PLEO|nr:hypothetical protein CC80DRAFT_518397 [Byssothecium circinans]